MTAPIVPVSEAAIAHGWTAQQTTAHEPHRLQDGRVIQGAAIEDEDQGDDDESGQLQRDHQRHG